MLPYYNKVCYILCIIIIIITFVIMIIIMIIKYIYIYIYIYGYGSKNRLDRPAVIRTSGTRGLRKGAWSRGFQGPN